MQFVGEPGEIPALAIGDERPIFHAHVGAGEPIGEVIGEAAVVQQMIGPAIEPRLGWLGLELANLFERRHAAGEGEREAARNGEVFGARGGGDAAAFPIVAERFIDPLHNGAELVVLRGARIKVHLARFREEGK